MLAVTEMQIREIVPPEPDGQHVKALMHIAAALIRHQVAAGAAAARELIHDLRIRLTPAAREGRTARARDGGNRSIRNALPRGHRGGHPARITVLSHVVVLDHEHGFPGLAVRQLPLRRLIIEGQHVTARARSRHGDGYEMLAVGSHSMAILTT